MWRQLSGDAHALGWPLRIDDYLQLINPLWSTYEARGRIERIHHETDDSVTLNIQQINVPPGAKQGNRMLDRIKGAPLSFKLEWTSADEVTMSPLAAAGIFGKSIVMRRKKE